MGEQDCEGCKFYRKTGWADGDGGECRRYAPRPGFTGLFWPQVIAGAWCGEWQAAADVVELTDEEITMVNKGYPLAAYHSVITRRKLTK